jgi:hypothetical protein
VRLAANMIERMKGLHRTLAILACLFLVVQTVRHAYLLWLEPRTSVLDKYEPLKDEIAAAASIDELVRRYDVAHKDAERVREQRRAAAAAGAHVDSPYEQDAEPFKSESMFREAIRGWEDRSKEIHSLRFYWIVGVVLAALGVAAYRRLNRWLGTTLLIVGFCEIIYWTTPTLFNFGGSARECERLLVNKFALSVVSLALLSLVLHQLRVFGDDKTGDV